MEKLPLILPTVGWDMFRFWEGHQNYTTWKGSMAIAMDPFATPQVLLVLPVDWRSHLPSVFRNVGFSRWEPRTNEPLEMTWVFSDIQYTVVAIECWLWEPRHCRILKGSGPINTTDCQSLTCTFHRVFAASRCRSDDFKQHPTDWCSSFKLAKNLNCPTSLVVSKIFNESQMIVAELDWFYVYQPRNIEPFTSYWSLEINDFAHIPLQNTQSSPTPPQQKRLAEGYAGYLPVVCGWDLRKHHYFLLAQRKYKNIC